MSLEEIGDRQRSLTSEIRGPCTSCINDQYRLGVNGDTSEREHGYKLRGYSWRKCDRREKGKDLRCV